MWHSRVDPICPPRRRASTTYIPAKALARVASHAAPASCGRLAWLHNGREIRSPTSGTITTGRPRPPSQKKPPRVPHAASKNLRQIPQPQVQADFTLHYEWPHSHHVCLKRSCHLFNNWCVTRHFILFYRYFIFLYWLLISCEHPRAQ